MKTTFTDMSAKGDFLPQETGETGVSEICGHVRKKYVFFTPFYQEPEVCINVTTDSTKLHVFDNIILDSIISFYIRPTLDGFEYIVHDLHHNL